MMTIKGPVMTKQGRQRQNRDSNDKNLHKQQLTSGGYAAQAAGSTMSTLVMCWHSVAGAGAIVGAAIVVGAGVTLLDLLVALARLSLLVMAVSLFAPLLALLLLLVCLQHHC